MFQGLKMLYLATFGTEKQVEVRFLYIFEVLKPNF